MTEGHRFAIGNGSKTRHVHQREDSSHDVGQARHDHQHVDATLADHIDPERHRGVGNGAKDARAIRRASFQESADSHGADGYREDQRQAGQDAHTSEDERSREGQDPVTRHSWCARANPVGRPRCEEVAPRRPPRVEGRQAAHQRQVLGDEISRSDQPQQRDERNDDGLGAERGHETRRARAKLGQSTLGDLVELFVLGKGRRETYAGRFGLFLGFERLFGGQDTSRLVVPLTEQRHKEVPQADGTADLESVQLGVGEDAQAVQLATTLANASALFDQPTPRTDNGARAVEVSSGEREPHFENVDNEERDQRPHHLSSSPARRDDEELMASLEVLTAGPSRTDRRHGTFARGDGFTVSHLGQRRHDDARARHLGAPAEVEILTEERDQRVETAQGRKEVGANERDTTGRHENVAFKVLLAVIDLAELHALAHDAEAVTRLSGV